MMDIEALARRKVELQAKLTAIYQTNIYGKTIDAMTELELEKIEALREIEQIEREIKIYIQQPLEREIKIYIQQPLEREIKIYIQQPPA